MGNLTHAEKLRLNGIKKHGSEAAWREFQRQNSNKSRRNQAGTGGFAKLKETNPELHKLVSARGGSVSKRTKEL